MLAYGVGYQLNNWSVLSLKKARTLQPFVGNNF